MGDLPNSEYARALLRDLGIEDEVPGVDWQKQVRERFGAAGKRFVSAASRMGDCDKLYGLKNASLELSLYVTSQKFQHVNVAFLEWIAGAFNGEPATVLDIGCDSGVLTCAMAKHWPGARFIGIEPNAKAAGVARQLVALHGLENVEVRCMRLEDIEAQASDLKNACDLVVGLCVFHDIFDTLRDFDQRGLPTFGIENAEIAELPDESAVRNVAYALAHEGLFLACSRWSDPGHTLRWMRLAEKASFQTDFANSVMLVADSPDRKESLPLTLHRVTANPVQATPDDVLSLHSSRSFHEIFRHVDFEGAVAEAIYRSLGAKEMLMGYEAYYYESAIVERQQVFVARSVAGIYQAMSDGYRRLQVQPLAGLPTLVCALAAAAEVASFSADVQNTPAGEIDQRWALYGVEEMLRTGILPESE